MNFIESCESVSRAKLLICSYLFKRRNESNNFSQDQAERISTSFKTLNPGLPIEVLISIAQLVLGIALTGLRRNMPETVTARANCARNELS
jgi:hypothetical protein